MPNVDPGVVALFPIFNGGESVTNWVVARFDQDTSGNDDQRVELWDLNGTVLMVLGDHLGDELLDTATDYASRNA